MEGIRVDARRGRPVRRAQPETENGQDARDARHAPPPALAVRHGGPQQHEVEHETEERDDEEVLEKQSRAGKEQRPRRRRGRPARLPGDGGKQAEKAGESLFRRDRRRFEAENRRDVARRIAGKHPEKGGAPVEDREKRGERERDPPIDPLRDPPADRILVRGEVPPAADPVFDAPEPPPRLRAGFRRASAGRPVVNLPFSRIHGPPTASRRRRGRCGTCGARGRPRRRRSRRGGRRAGRSGSRARGAAS